MREVKKEINLLDENALNSILKKRNSAHIISNTSKAVKFLGAATWAVGLLAKEPISSIVGASVVFISTLTEFIAEKKERDLDDDIKKLCGKSYRLMKKEKQINAKAKHTDEEYLENE